jgi:molybdopterin-guanine dinucleotide biosynthesis protein A
MGSDKTQLRLAGVTLLDRALATAQQAGFSVSVSLAAGSTLAAQLARRGISAVVDRRADQGPLGGIEAAFESFVPEPGERVLFLAVDLPRLPAAFLRWLWDRASLTGALATIPVVDGQDQPLCAVYSTTLAAPIGMALDAGDRKIMRVLRQAMPPDRLDRFQVESIAPLLGWPRPQLWFTNVNTPDEWAALQPASGDDLSPSRI